MPANNTWVATAASSLATNGNWSSGTANVTGDSAFFVNSTFGATSGLDQSAVTLAVLEAELSFTGEFGTAAAYGQFGATIFNYGRNTGLGSPSGSARFKIDLGSVQSAMNIFATSSSSTDTYLEPLRIKGTHASNVARVYGGTVGFGTTLAGEAYTLATLDVLGNANVNLGIGGTLTTINNDGGNIKLRSAATTVTMISGTLINYGTGAITTETVIGGTLTQVATGTVGTLTVAEAATVNLWAAGALTVTTVNLSGFLDLSEMTGALSNTTFNIRSDDARIYDPWGRIAGLTLTKAPGVTKVNYEGRGTYTTA